jgi:hypothetical protein
MKSSLVITDPFSFYSEQKVVEALKQALDSKYFLQNQIPRAHLGLVPPALEAYGGNNVLQTAKEIPFYALFFWELRGLSLNFHLQVSVLDSYIPRIGPHISCSRIGRSIMRIYKSLTDT